MTFLYLIIALFVIILLSKGLVIVKQAEVIIIERLGRYKTTLDSGLHIIWPIFDKTRQISWRYTKTDFKGNRIIQIKNEYRIDLRETVYDFPRQNVITADNVSIEIDALLYFQVTDPKKAVYEIANLPQAIEKLTQTTLRNVIGELDLDKTLTSRDTINSKLRDILDEATDKWGVKVNRVELQDINPPQEIKMAMEKQMRAERDRRAKILVAEGEKRSNILVAEGEKEAQIARAEGEAKAKYLVAEAEGRAILKVAEAVEKTGTDPAQYLLAVKYIKAFNEIVQNQDKTVVVPYEASAMLGSIKSMEKIFKS
ncbi:MAG: SPFH/Band 7/PHB domain protein [Candidatus Cloacimonetes bacterium]|nr:SPFH/Band 7/PHB domain protein [Candidatus Cloacimonadota bacterium]MCF7814986.1 SPFH/Band 7/PHB domain protein [Candidatus Cloacimonadota bacterium]MCF7868402.1 SPFH/Band 7/PHB domain protein [Candidatus Cloacimonadota bacterium]MCF7883875.1 SPFH/Band 7/PHB domain protein [Candidatus Cloacimonadota bacterium]